MPCSAQSQTIVFDVTQPLEEIQAPQDTVKSTAIALVKVDSTFLPGTTIGATQWVAYAMTKGTYRCFHCTIEQTLIVIQQAVSASFPARAATGRC